MIKTQADREAACRLLGIAPAAAWLWTASEIENALRNGLLITNYGVQILPEGW